MQKSKDELQKILRPAYTPYDSVEDRFSRKILVEIAAHFATIDSWCAQYAAFTIVLPDPAISLARKLQSSKQEHIELTKMMQCLTLAREATERLQDHTTVCFGDLGDYCNYLCRQLSPWQASMPKPFGDFRFPVIYTGDDAIHYLQDNFELEYWKAIFKHLLANQKFGMIPRSSVDSVAKTAVYGIMAKLKHSRSRLTEQIPELVQRGIDERISFLQDLIDQFGIDNVENERRDALPVPTDVPLSKSDGKVKESNSVR